MSEVLDSAVIELGLDNALTGPLTAAVAEAEAEIDRLGAKKAKIRVDVDTTKARAELKELEAQQSAATKALEDYKKKYEEQPKSRGGMSAQLKQLESEAKATREATAAKRADIDALTLKGRVISQVGREISAVTQQQAQDDRAAARASKERAQADDLARTATLRRSQEIQKAVRLNEQYVKAQQKVNDLDKAYSRAQGSDKIRVKLDGARAMADMAAIREELKVMGRDPIDIKTKVDSPSGSGGVTGFLKKVSGGDDPRALRDIGSELGSLGSKLKSARVNIGPFSTSLSTMLIAGSALAPVISGLVGTVGALGGAIGAGLGGALGVGGAAMTGFGMAVLGGVAAVKPFITQVGNARKYQAAYNAVVAKYGEGSKQATAAQKVLNHEMSTVPKQAREAVQGFSDLSKSWKGMTQQAATHDIGNMIGASFKTAGADMHWFAQDTNSALGNVTSGWDKWMQQLRSPKMSGALDNIFQNFSNSIPSVMAGLGSLGDAFTQIMSSFSNFLPSLGQGFQNWAKNIDNAATRSHGFANGVRTMVNAMQSLGHFTMAAGRVLGEFFKAGTGSGVGLINDMTDGLNRLAKSMGTVAGQSRLQDFFGRSVGTTKELWGTITSLGSAFMAMGAALRPVATIMLTLVSAFAKAVGWLTAFKPLDYALGGAAALLFISKMTAGLREAGMLMGRLAAGALEFGLSLAFQGGGGIKGALQDAKRVMGMGQGAGSAGAAAAYEAAISSSSAEGAAAMGAAIESAGSAVAGEFAASIEGAGAANAAENAVSKDIPAVAPVAEAAPIAEAAPVAEDVGAGALGAEAGAVAPEVEGLTGALSALAPEILLPIAGIAGLVAGLSLLNRTTSDATKSEQALHQVRQVVASNKSNITSGAQSPAFQVGASGQSVGGSAASQEAVNKAASAYYKLVRQGKGDTEAGREAAQEYTDAINSQQSAMDSANTFRKQSNDLIQKQVDLQQGNGLKAQKALTSAQKDYNEAYTKYHNDLKDGNVSEEARNKDLADLTKTTKNLHDAQDGYNTVQKQAIELANQDATAKLNIQRQLTGMTPVAERYSQAVGAMTRSLASAGPAGASALRALSQVPDPQKVVSLAHAYNQLHNAADKKSAVNIIANTDDPASAIKQLNGLVLKEKTLKIRGEASNAINAIKEVNGGKVPEKVLRLMGDASKAIAAHNYVAAMKDLNKILKIAGDIGGAKAAHGAVNAMKIALKTLLINGNPAAALQAISKVIGTNVPGKTATVTAEVGQALSAIGSVIGEIGSVSSKSVTITTNHIDVYTKKGNPSMGGAAMGGIGGATGYSAQLAGVQAHAARVAANRPVQHTQGGIYSNPTYLVGEENKPEYVIATNPAYRQQNRQYLASAAATLGMRVEAAAAGRKPKGAEPITYQKYGKQPRLDKGERKELSKDEKGASKAGTKSEKTTVSHPQYNFNAILPPGERIGGLDTSDIDSAISNVKQLVSNDKTNLNRANTSLKTDMKKVDTLQNGINRINGIKVTKTTPSKTQISDRKEYRKELIDANKQVTADHEAVSRLSSVQKVDTNKLNKLNIVLSDANNRIARFSQLETDMSTVNDLMSAASANDSDSATGVVPAGYGFKDGGTQQLLTWAQWNSIEKQLQAEHVKELRKAWADMKTKVSKLPKGMNRLDKDVDVGYVRTLANALSESIAEEDAADEAKDTWTAGGDTTPSTPESLADFVAGKDPSGVAIPGLQDQSNYLAELQYNLTTAENSATANPGAPGNLAAEQAAAQNLLDYYQKTVMPEAQGWKNPTFTPPAQDFSLMNEVAGAISDAQSTVSGIAQQGQGPTQAQLTSTGLSSLYATYGGNAASTLLGGPSGAIMAAATGMSPDNMANALLGGQVASQALASQSAGVSVPSAAPAPQAQAAPAASHTVINNFQQPPADPHTWSKNISWELGSLV